MAYIVSFVWKATNKDGRKESGLSYVRTARDYETFDGAVKVWARIQEYLEAKYPASEGWEVYALEDDCWDETTGDVQDILFDMTA